MFNKSSRVKGSRPDAAAEEASDFPMQLRDCSSGADARVHRKEPTVPPPHKSTDDTPQCVGEAGATSNTAPGRGVVVES